LVSGHYGTKELMELLILSVPCVTAHPTFPLLCPKAVPSQCSYEASTAS